MPTRSSKNNILAGVLVLGSIGLGVAVVITLSDLSERLVPMETYRVRFSLTDGAEGLKPGSIVKVGGLQVGRVIDSTFDRKDKDSEPTAVLVTVKIRSDLKLYEDAIVQLNLPLLGSNSSINIPILGTGERVPEGKMQGTSTLLEPGETLRGSMAPPSFLASAGYGPEQSGQVQSIIARVEHITASIEEKWDPKVRQVLDDVRSVTADVRENWPTWRDRVTAALDNVKSASDKFGSITDTVKAGVEDAKAIISDNRPRIDNTMKDVEALAHKANTEGWDSLMAAITKGQKGIDDFADMTERADRLLKESVPQLRTMVANARLASDELKLTLAEVRAGPWKLLSKPTGRKDLENEALYDSARAYSVAVSDLKAASSALEAVTAAGGGADHKDDVATIVSDLDAAFQKYREAEKRFLEKLTK